MNRVDTSSQYARSCVALGNSKIVPAPHTKPAEKSYTCNLP